jgi:hypothetical protein
LRRDKTAYLAQILRDLRESKILDSCTRAKVMNLGNGQVQTKVFTGSRKKILTSEEWVRSVNARKPAKEERAEDWITISDKSRSTTH